MQEDQENLGQLLDRMNHMISCIDCAQDIAEMPSTQQVIQNMLDIIEEASNAAMIMVAKRDISVSVTVFDLFASD